MNPNYHQTDDWIIKVDTPQAKFHAQTTNLLEPSSESVPKPIITRNDMPLTKPGATPFVYNMLGRGDPTCKRLSS